MERSQSPDSTTFLLNSGATSSTAFGLGWKVRGGGEEEEQR